jgi:hypothetical protein
MQLTNKHNLPETFVNVIKRPTYTKGKANLSITELIDSPRVVNMKHRHWDDITVDASEMVWSLFGTAVHGVLEHGKGDNHIVEERLNVVFEGWHLSGAIDLQEVDEDGGIHIKDYKVTGAWSVRNEKQAWHDQLNCYAWLVEIAKQKEVKSLQIVAIIRDWSAREAAIKEDYPQAPIVSIDIPLWPMIDRTEFVEKRLQSHAEAYFESESGGDLPECTPEDMWEKPEKFAVMKEGGKRAKSVHNTEQEAKDALPAKGYFIEVRQGERTRCQSFCQVSQFCEQWKRYQEDSEIKSV